MGAKYTNITLCGPSQDRVVAALEQLERTAYVSPTVNGFTVVFDEECENQDPNILETLASDLSGELGCAVLVILNHDEDVLMYWLCERGELVDQYNSTPDYFTGMGPSTPRGGNAEKLCRTFGATGRVAEVDSILCRPSGIGDEAYLFATDRHADLAQALDLPDFSVGLGYWYVGGRATSDDFEPGNLKHVG